MYSIPDSQKVKIVKHSKGWYYIMRVVTEIRHVDDPLNWYCGTCGESTLLLDSFMHQLHVYPENDMEFYDINGDYVSIHDDFENFAKDHPSLSEESSDCDLCKEYMYYYLKNIGFSLNRICKVDINNI